MHSSELIEVPLPHAPRTAQTGAIFTNHVEYCGHSQAIGFKVNACLGIADASNQANALKHL